MTFFNEEPNDDTDRIYTNLSGIFGTYDKLVLMVDGLCTAKAMD